MPEASSTTVIVATTSDTLGIETFLEPSMARSKLQRGEINPIVQYRWRS
jgi:hypothetical protein